jgi:hypothetical protein
MPLLPWMCSDRPRLLRRRNFHVSLAQQHLFQTILPLPPPKYPSVPQVALPSYRLSKVTSIQPHPDSLPLAFPISKTSPSFLNPSPSLWCSALKGRYFWTAAELAREKNQIPFMGTSGCTTMIRVFFVICNSEKRVFTSLALCCQPRKCEKLLLRELGLRNPRRK